MVSLVHTGNFTSVHVEDSRSFNIISAPPSTGSVKENNMSIHHLFQTTALNNKTSNVHINLVNKANSVHNLFLVHPLSVKFWD
jgi:hypothetical protein